MNKKKLHIIRRKIDQVDNKLFSLIKKRTALVKYLLKIKNKKNQIMDKRRTNEILHKIKRKSIKNKIDPNITSTIWKSIILAYVKFQNKNFKK